MSKKEKKDFAGQAKPKLKIKVNFNEEDHILNEYDLAKMISDLNVKVAQLQQAVNGITAGMQAATNPPVHQSTAPQHTTLELPKLNNVKLES